MRRADLPPGAKVITTKWVDTNKGTEEEPNYRSRLVGREIKRDQRPDPFAATPPLESLRFVVSLCASAQGAARPHRLLTVDVKSAYFYAPAIRPVYVRLPDEDKEPGDEKRCGRLRMSMYGTRDAAANFQQEVRRVMLSIGFAQSKYNPGIYYHVRRQLRTLVHGDDFVTCAEPRQAQWLK